MDQHESTATSSVHPHNVCTNGHIPKYQRPKPILTIPTIKISHFTMWRRNNKLFGHIMNHLVDFADTFAIRLWIFEQYYFIGTSGWRRCYHNRWYPHKLKSLSSITSITYAFQNIAQSTAVSLPCSVHNFETIRQLRIIYGQTVFYEVRYLDEARVNFAYGYIPRSFT